MYMEFNIRGNKIAVTDAIKNYAEEKLGKLDKYFENPDDIRANVLIKVVGIDQGVEVTIPVKKLFLRAEEKHKDLYAAIDLVVEKLERQIRKNKTRIKQSKISKGMVLDFNLDKEEEEEERTVVKRKNIEMKPMTIEEAILQMNLLGHDFFIFKEIETEKICVLYQRKDKNYGVIETN